MKHSFVLRRRRSRESVNKKILAKYPPLVLVEKSRGRNKQDPEPEPEPEPREEEEELTQPQRVNMPYNL